MVPHAALLCIWCACSVVPLLPRRLCGLFSFVLRFVSCGVHFDGNRNLVMLLLQIAVMQGPAGCFGSCFGDNLDTFGVWRIDSRAVCIQFLTDHIWSGDPISRALSPFSYQTQTTCKAPISVVRCCGSVSCHCLFWQCVFHFPLSVTGFGFVVFFLRICYLLATEFSAASASGA